MGGFGNQVILLLAHTIEHEELLEVIKLEGVISCPEDTIMPRDMFLLQEASSPSRTLDLASAREVGLSGNKSSTDNSASGSNMRLIMTIAFQFAFESHLQDNVASMARQYVRSIISSVQRVAVALSPHLGFHAGLRSPHGNPEAYTLARWICQSYRNGLLMEKEQEGSNYMHIQVAHKVLQSKGKILLHFWS